MSTPGQAAAASFVVPDHALLRRIASGSYGSVWLARNVLGTFRAVKIVERRSFKQARQYEREFVGVTHFEPISRTHPGFVHLLHVGRDDVAGHFYYIMEAADDVAGGRRIEPATYRPRTLRAELDARGRLPLDECVRLGRPLLLALEELHRRGLVHRDIKPANFIFVEGAPKFADIGLVVNAGTEHTLVGSIGYYPPEGSGRPASDLFSFGRVLYELFTGVKVQEAGDRLPDLSPRLTSERARRFYALVMRACHADPGQRPASAQTLHDALEEFLPPGAAAAVPAAVRPASGAAEPGASGASGATDTFESIGGAVRPGSPLYLEREGDGVLAAGIERGEGVILIAGSRQMGKSSLLARGLRRARAAGRRAVCTDLQRFNRESFETLSAFYLALGGVLADQLELGAGPAEAWDPARAPNANFDRFMRRRVLARESGHLVWGLDGVDRVLTCPFNSEFFALIRSWYNERAFDADCAFLRLTVAISYATDVRLFITNLDESPFNVGVRIDLGDFTPDEIEELNRRHGAPLRTAAELAAFHHLTGGQPFLCQLGLRELATRGGTLAELERETARDAGAFAEALRRVLALATQEPALTDAVRALLGGAGGAGMELRTFDRLRSVGIVTGHNPAEARLRCELYERYLRRHLA